MSYAPCWNLELKETKNERWYHKLNQVTHTVSTTRTAIVINYLNILIFIFLFSKYLNWLMTIGYSVTSFYFKGMLILWHCNAV